MERSDDDRNARSVDRSTAGTDGGFAIPVGGAEEVTILHVDDDAQFTELTATMLERTRDRFHVRSETDTGAVLDVIAESNPDCVVSDYEMPGRDGLELLRAVRHRDPDLPFVLFTGKGSEEIASEAISAGVTDYVQKGGSDSYDVLANRVAHAVDRARARKHVERGYRAMEAAKEGISHLDGDGVFTYANRAYAEILGYDPDELIGEHWKRIYPEIEIERVCEEVLPSVPTDVGESYTEVTTWVRRDGSRIEVSHTLAYNPDGTLVCLAKPLDADARPNDDSAEASVPDPTPKPE